MLSLVGLASTFLIEFNVLGINGSRSWLESCGDHLRYICLLTETVQPEIVLDELTVPSTVDGQ